MGGDRRLEGPLGKADRSIVLAILGAIIAAYDGLPHAMLLLAPLLCAGSAITIWNRVRFALADARRGGEAVE